jgi:phosphinothricin acetyltransferase
MTKIRPAADSDISSITAIYADHVLHGTGTFETTPPDAKDMAARRADVLARNLPYLVLEDASGVVGFAYCNWFKPRPAYRFSAEDSIYLAPAAAGKGLGRLLLTELMAQAERCGVRQMLAVIGDSNNHGSIGVHRSCGFEHTGVLRSSGWKFGRWLDVVLMQRSLGLGDSAPAQSADEK